jgi:hypothetical protein
MKNILFIVLCCGLSLVCDAQKLFQTEREEFNIRVDDFAVIGKYKQWILAYRKRSANAEIIFYTEKMAKVKSLPLEFLPDNFSNIQFVSNENTILVFYESKESKKQNLYATKLLSNDIWQSPVLLSSKPTSFIKDYVPYKFSVSENKKYTLFYNSYYLSGDNTVQAVVVDDELNILKQVNQIFSDKEYYISDRSAISNKGLPYLLATDKLNSRGNLEELKILSLSDFARDLTVFPLSIDKHFLNDVQIAVDNKNSNIYIASFFSDGKYSNPRGIYFAIFDEEKQATTTSHFIPVALQVSKSNSDLKDIRMRHIFIKSDGGFELVAEKYYQNMRTLNSINPIMNSSFMTGPDNARTVTEYYYDEIYIFNFKNEGSLKWSQTVLKEQLSTDDGGIFSSFSTLQYPIGNAYIFNDLSSKNTRLLSCYVTSKGEMNMKEIQTNEQIDEWNLMPRSAKQISKSEMIIPCIMKNHVSFLKLTF